MKVTTKKILAFLCAGLMLIQSAGTVVFADDAVSDEGFGHAEVWFANTAANKNIKELNLFENSGVPKYEMIDGKTWLVLGNNNKQSVLTVGINLNDEQFEPWKMHTLRVAVTYLDKGRGHIPLQAFLGDDVWYVDPVKIQMTDTGEVKTHTWVVTVMSTNRYLYGDVAIGGYTTQFGYSKENVYVSDVTIDLLCPEEPLKADVDSSEAGNVLDYDKERKFAVSVENITPVKVEGSITYEIRGEFDNVIETGELGNVNLESGEKKDFEIIPSVNKFGVYTLALKYDTKLLWSGKEENKVYEQPVEFSIIDGFEPEQKKNEWLKAMLEVINERYKYEEKWEGVKNSLVKSGLGGIRDETLWHDVELKAGEFTRDRRDWLWEELYKMGFENMFLALGTNRVRVAAENPIARTPEEVEALGDYIEFCIKNYGQYIEYIEIWNEPNMHSTAEEYLRILKEGYERTKKLDPRIKVSGIVTSMVPFAYIEESFKLGALDYMDAVCVHPYDWMNPVFRDQVYIDDMKQLRELCARYGKPDIEIVLSEVGVHLGVQDDGTPLSSVHRQAADGVQMFAVTDAYNLVDELYWYDFVNKGTNYASNEHNWGMIKNGSAETPFAAKPVYVATVAFNQLLADAEFKDSIEDGTTRILKFKRNQDGKDVIMLWTEEGNNNLRLNLGTSEIDVLDMYGNSLGKLHDASGCYDFMSGFDPIYIIGNFSKFEKTTPDIMVENGRMSLTTSDSGIIKIRDAKKRSLRVEVDASANVEVAEVKNITNGYGEIRIVTNEKSVFEQPIDIKLFDGEELVYITRAFTEHRLSPVEVTITPGVYSDELSDMGKVTVNIKNMNFSDTISGTVLSDFSAVDGGVQSRQIVEILPGETRSYEFYIPRSSLTRTLEPDFQINLDNGYSTTIKGGSMASYIAVYNQNGKSDVKTGLFGAVTKSAATYFPDWRGKTDASFVGSATWDEEKLYMHLYGFDDIQYQPEEGSLMWRADSFQIGIENLTANGKEAKGGAFTELTIGLTPKGPELYRQSPQSGSGLSVGTIENSQVEIVCENGTISYKFAVPWTELFGESAKVEEGQKLGFAVLYNDSDGVKISPSDFRRGSLMFNGGISPNKKAELFGDMVLSK